MLLHGGSGDGGCRVGGGCCGSLDVRTHSPCLLRGLRWDTGVAAVYLFRFVDAKHLPLQNPLRELCLVSCVVCGWGKEQE